VHIALLRVGTAALILADLAPGIGLWACAWACSYRMDIISMIWLGLAQTIAMLNALNKALPLAECRLVKWVEKAAGEAKAGGKQRKVQQQRQQQKKKAQPTST
jgi:hypothetical protein